MHLYLWEDQMKRDSWVNIRGLAILLVIVIHATSSQFNSVTSTYSYLNLFLNQISRFAVPIFLISSGFGLTLKKEYEMPTLHFF